MIYDPDVEFLLNTQIIRSKEEEEFIKQLKTMRKEHTHYIFISPK